LWPPVEGLSLLTVRANGYAGCWGLRK